MDEFVDFSETTGGNRKGVLPQSPRCPGCGGEFHTIMSFPTIIFTRDTRAGLSVVCEGVGYIHYRDATGRHIYMYSKGVNS